MGPRASVRKLTDSPVPLYLAAYAEGPVDLDRVGRQAVTAFQRVAAYFGTVPFKHYTMHQELLTPVSPRHEYGMSMEHLESSTYYLAASSGLTANATPEDEARVLYNFAHHVAHSWVPKRAYGRGYFPFQWELAPVIDGIWFAEGFGQYAAIMAVAAGTPDPQAFRAGMLERRFRANVATAPAFLKKRAPSSTGNSVQSAPTRFMISRISTPNCPAPTTSTRSPGSITDSAPASSAVRPEPGSRMTS